VAFALERLAERRRDSGLDFVGVPTSAAPAARARALGLPLTPRARGGAARLLGARVASAPAALGLRRRPTVELLAGGRAG
ncbi:MAG: hypothetical protein ACO3ZY_04560, partial [Phycisphaerales bacterium]